MQGASTSPVRDRILELCCGFHNCCLYFRIAHLPSAYLAAKVQVCGFGYIHIESQNTTHLYIFTEVFWNQ